MFGSFLPFQNPITDPYGRASMWTTERMIWVPLTMPQEERVLVDIRTIKQVRENRMGGSILVLDGGSQIQILEGFSKVVEIMKGAVE